MPGLLFVSQVALEAWAEQRKVDLQGDVMTLAAGEGRGRSYDLDPAVLFLRVLNGETDPNHLLAKVKTAAKLQALGAEHVEDSVVLGDVAYQVQPGFLAEGRSTFDARSPDAVAKPGAAGLRAPAGRRASGAPKAELLPRELEERRREAEALARYLLENLS